jgi:MFS family permease
VIRFLLGAAEAGFFPGVLFYLTVFFPSAYRGRMVGWYMAAIPLSAVVGAPLSSFLLYLDGGFGLRGWQWIFITEAVPSVILSFVVLFYLTDDPKDAKWLADDQRGWLVRWMGAERQHRLATHDMSVWQVLINPRVLMLGVAGFAIAHSISGISFFLPQIIKAFGLSNMQTGLVTAIPFAIGAAAMIWYGRRSDRLMERRSHCSIALLLTAIGLVAAAMLEDPYLRLASLCFASFGAFAVLPVFWAMPTAFLSGAAAAAGVAYINSIANLASFVGPFLTGWIKDATGSFTGGLILIAATQIIGAIAILCIEHDRGLEHAPEALAAE